MYKLTIATVCTLAALSIGSVGQSFAQDQMPAQKHTTTVTTVTKTTTHTPAGHVTKKVVKVKKCHKEWRKHKDGRRYEVKVCQK